MKMVITIGTADFLAPSAADAAKIADLIGRLVPLRTTWSADSRGFERPRLFAGEAPPEARVDRACHRVSIATASEPDVFESYAALKACLEPKTPETPEGGDQ